MSNYKVCPECMKKKKTVEQRRQNTRYTNDELNYVVMCKGCFKERQEYWKMMWSEYRDSVGFGDYDNY